MSETEQGDSPGLGQETDAVLAFGPFLFDRSGSLLYRNGTEVPLPPRALEVLECLLDRPGRVVAKRELMQ